MDQEKPIEIRPQDLSILSKMTCSFMIDHAIRIIRYYNVVYIGDSHLNGYFKDMPCG